MSQGYGLPNMSNVAFFSSDDPIVKFWPNALQPVVPSVAHHSQDSYPAPLTDAATDVGGCYQPGLKERSSSRKSRRVAEAAGGTAGDL
ncbi:hypothetical protein, variant [Aphanomyces astaci]|uniref:Uncharacterized protein n=1 Tax=Aphanomyces astaci TaxID=112090 RepID=W4GFC8_APHAT|nr:hypothetical protein H257_08610 [Aphanomyces astaci]XP_009832875.1 hypothetical protein, variant [Aphanomyces astaci]ETV77764.1 hypothetical protein H257_08610 [Aphanomyces astaci]ETV77765.1 hypothetical protein, variant [Aphanomyces astaci]|eukprot:XP_009832874.1 hypothetical protein H257_08610 [Aphanomyces astaci]